MAWYDKYMTIYGKPFSEVPQEVIDGTRERLAKLQSPEPLASIVVIMKRHICKRVYGLLAKYSVNILWRLSGWIMILKTVRQRFTKNQVFPIIRSINIHVAMLVDADFNMLKACITSM